MNKRTSKNWTTRKWKKNQKKTYSPRRWKRLRLKFTTKISNKTRQRVRNLLKASHDFCLISYKIEKIKMPNIILKFHPNKYPTKACTSLALTFPLSITASKLTISAIRSSTRQSKTECGIIFIFWTEKTENYAQLPFPSKMDTTNWKNTSSDTFHINTATAPFTTNTNYKNLSKPSTFLIIIDIS